MNKLLRFLWVLWRARRATPLAPTDVGSVRFRVLPNDLDLQRHMNNGVYLSLMDLGRIDLMVRSGVWGELTARGYYPVIVSSTITYRRSLELWQTYELESRIVGIDDIAAYVEQRFVRDGEIVARAVIKARFLKKSGGIVPIPELAELFDMDPQNHPLPAWLAEWSGNAALPSRREPAPSVWE
ncbi:acyl-CoA thioesterase [Microcella humidisoli]|uniref:Thioesterase family protein n=1 Tax=Microcella humidisoli TaxID=2963406 RepID=A0ABY5FZ48_9MICO|nr:acyl-CoA thioesterase [Microcella humidisoli]UTT63569.1 thioesterase family protein [Microcella humidisoli]